MSLSWFTSIQPSSFWRGWENPVHPRLLCSRQSCFVLLNHLVAFFFFSCFDSSFWNSLLLSFRATPGACRAAAARRCMGRHGAFQLSGEGQAHSHCGVAPQLSAIEPVATPSGDLTGAACAPRRAAGWWHVPVHGGERRGQLTGSHKTSHCPNRYKTLY